MGELRTYLDRGEKIRLEGRPLEVDWPILLGLGRHMRRGSTPALGARRPLLVPAAWEDEGLPYLPRPVAFDFPVLREWIGLESSDAVSYLRSVLGPDHAPWGAIEALDAMDRESCAADGSYHRAYPMKQTIDTDEGTWMVGVCGLCLRAIVGLHVDLPLDEVWWDEWDLYEQEVAS